MQQIKWRNAKEEVPEFIKYKVGTIKGQEVIKDRDYSDICLIVFDGKVRVASWCTECIGKQSNRVHKWNFCTKEQSDRVTHWCYVKDINTGDLT